MNIKKGNELLSFIWDKTKHKYERKYVNHFYEKMKNEKFSYVFYGLRRIGKTTMCFQILNKFLENKIYNENEVAFLDIELELSLGTTSESIKRYIFEFLKNNKIKLFFFDEVQLLENWDMFIKSINDHFINTKIICSGSSSYNLKEKESGVGRFIKINIQPLMFNEFIEIRKKEIKNLSKRETIDFYLKETPFFEIWKMKDEDSKKRYMLDILEKTIIYDLNFIVNRSFTPSYMKQIIREISLSETGELSFEKIRSIFFIPKTTFYEYINIMQSIGILNILERYNKNLTLSKRGPNKYYLSFPFFYNLYINSNNVFNIGKRYESLFLMYLNYKYNIENLERKIFYIKDKDKTGIYQEIDFYIPEEKIAYELKTKNINFNNLYLELSESSSINLKTIDIENLYDFLKE